MKQIIVNVGDLTIEEKQRVSETLAKITNVRMCNPLYWDVVVLLYGPSSDGVNVGFGYYEAVKTTHTPQQVIAMAEMEPAAEQTILADTLIITDSSGNLIYDSTVHALNRVIEQRANSGKGDRDKLDKNGAAEMVEKRKVRKDFDPKQPISVDVSNCTEEEKKEVQQAFYDVGIKWESGVSGFPYLFADSYTNSVSDGTCRDHLMYGILRRTDSISRQQFLSMVYEPEQQGHVHAHLMAQYAEDAKTTDKPWELWQIRDCNGNWNNAEANPVWLAHAEYRRKPKMKIIHGVAVPDISFTPEDNEYYFYPDPTMPCMYEMEYFHNYAEECGHRLTNKMCYPTTDEGREAAILHAKAMLGVQP